MNARVHENGQMGYITYKYEQFDCKKEITHIIYQYVNGERVEIEITEELRPILTELKRLEDNSNKRESRHCTTFLHDSQKTVPSIYEESDRRERNANFARALKQLLPEQQKLLYQRYYLEIPVNEMALRNGVVKSAISHRLARARTKLKKLLI